MCIRDQPYFITIPATQQLPCGHIVCLTNNIPQSHLHATHTTGLPALTAELFYHFEYHLHVTWIQAQDSAFQHQCIALIGTISYFTQAIDALVGINAYDSCSA